MFYLYEFWSFKILMATLAAGEHHVRSIADDEFKIAAAGVAVVVINAYYVSMSFRRSGIGKARIAAAIHDHAVSQTVIEHQAV